MYDYESIVIKTFYLLGKISNMPTSAKTQLGALNVNVIVVENGIGGPSSIRRRSCLPFPLR